MIKNIAPRWPRLGRISCGYAASRKTPSGAVVYPVRSETFVFASDSTERLQAVARTFGGSVEPSPDPQREGLYRVITRAREIEVVLPAEDDRGWDAWWELWGASGCLRRCDGETALLAVDPETGEREEGVPCVCAARGLQRTDPMHCKPTSRLNVVIPALKDAPGLGLWQVQSRGLSTYMSIHGALDLVRRFGSPVGVPFLLRIITNRTRDPATGETRKFPTIIVTARESFEQAFRRRVVLQAPPESLPEPDRDTPPLGAGLSEEQERAASEHELPEPVHAPDEPVQHQEPAAPAAHAGAPHIPNATEFWTAVRAAARGGDPAEWVRARTGGEANLRKLDSQTIRRLYAEAKAAAATPRPGHSRPTTELRDLLSAIQEGWRAQGTSHSEQAAMVRSITRGRTAVPGELTPEEAMALLNVIRGMTEVQNAHAT